MSLRFCWAFLCRSRIRFLVGPLRSRMGKRPAFFMFRRCLVRKIATPEAILCFCPFIPLGLLFSVRSMKLSALFDHLSCVFLLVIPLTSAIGETIMPFITCPKCHNSYDVPANYINRDIQCGFCGVVFTAFSGNTASPNDIICTCDNKQYTKSQIIEIAKNQKWFIFFILLYFAIQCIFKALFDGIPEIRPLVLFFVFVFFIAEVFFCVKMMLAVKMNTVSIVVLAILSFIPCIGIFVAVALNCNANKVLKAAGLNVGFFGVSQLAIRQLQDS